MTGVQTCALPISFRFPATTVKAVCDLFMFGIPSLRIQPFRMIKKASSLPCVGSNLTYFSKGKSVFKVIASCIVNHGRVAELAEVERLSVANWDEAFGEAYTYILYQFQLVLDQRIYSANDLAFLTFYDLYNTFAYEAK